MGYDIDKIEPEKKKKKRYKSYKHGFRRKYKKFGGEKMSCGKSHKKKKKKR